MFDRLQQLAVHGEQPGRIRTLQVDAGVTLARQVSAIDMDGQIQTGKWKNFMEKGSRPACGAQEIHVTRRGHTIGKTRKTHTKSPAR